MSELDGLAFARLFRSSCTVCGSERLSWGSVGDEVGRLVDSGQDPDNWLSQVARGVGLDVGPGSWRSLPGDVWRAVRSGSSDRLRSGRDGSGLAAAGGTPQAKRAARLPLPTRTVSGLPGTGVARALVRRGLPDVSP